MQVTHMLSSGLRAVELDTDVFAIEGASATTRMSLEAHAVQVVGAPEGSGSIDVSDATFDYAKRIVDDRRRVERRMAEFSQ